MTELELGVLFFFLGWATPLVATQDIQCAEFFGGCESVVRGFSLILKCKQTLKTHPNILSEDIDIDQ
jgi:hypothetical protein